MIDWSSMTFQELLIKTRGKDWTPPRRLIAIDPGETCGYVVFTYDKLEFVGQEKDFTKVIAYMTLCNAVVYEDYKIYPGKLKAHSFSDIPTLKLIGVIEYTCEWENIKVIKQLASTVKGFCTNEKLKEWGFYQKGKPHANDAIRHGCWALLFSKELL